MGFGKSFITSLRLGSSSIKLKGYWDSKAGREAERRVSALHAAYAVAPREQRIKGKVGRWKTWGKNMVWKVSV